MIGRGAAKEGVVKIALYLSTLMAIGCLGPRVNIENPDFTPIQLLDDAAFAPLEEVPTVEEMKRLNLKTRQALRRDFDDREPYQTVRKWFVRYIQELFSNFSYTEKTTVAQTTLDTQKGNCLSLALLTAALADELRIPYRFQEVLAPPTWDRQNGVLLVNRHVNDWIFEPVLDDRDQRANRQFVWATESASVIDYFPMSKSYPADILADGEVLAMYYNNLAAEAIIDRSYQRAYALIRQALSLNAADVSAWNMLGLVYGHTQNDMAEYTFMYALTLAPDDLSTINNLSIWLKRVGRVEESADWKSQLIRAESDNPFTFYDRAETALEQEEYRTAIVLYRKAIRADEYQHEFHFGLFKAYWMLGKHDRASKALKRAIEISDDERSLNLYHSKLDQLNRI